MITITSNISKLFNNAYLKIKGILNYCYLKIFSYNKMLNYMKQKIQFLDF